MTLTMDRSAAKLTWFPILAPAAMIVLTGFAVILQVATQYAFALKLATIAACCAALLERTRTYAQEMRAAQRGLSQEFSQSWRARFEQLEEPETGRERGETNLRRFLSDLFIHLLPMFLLSTIYVLIGKRVEGIMVGGIHLSQLVLYVALSLPLLAQMACMPLFTRLGEDVYRYGREVLAMQLAARLPGVFLPSALVTALYAAAVARYQLWEHAALLFFLRSMVLHVLFSQLLVYGFLAKEWGAWSLAWIAYAVAFLVVPEHADLVPLAGIAVMAGFLAWRVRARPRLVADEETPRLMLRGIGVGAIIWADKVAMTILYPDRLQPVVVFVSLIPSVLLLNYFYVRHAPLAESRLKAALRSMEHDAVPVFDRQREICFMQIRRSLVEMFLLGGLATFLSLLLISQALPAQLADFGIATLTGWFLSFEAVIVHLLLIVRARGIATALSGYHVAGIVVGSIAATTIASLQAYAFAFTLASLPILTVIARQTWRNPEYSMFWRPHLSW
jgi:hypothetical protein